MSKRTSRSPRRNPAWESLWDFTVDPVIQELEEAWAGGVADFGDASAADAVVEVPGYESYRQQILDAVERIPPDEYMDLRGVRMYRSMSRDDAEYMERGGSLGPKGFTFRRDLADAWHLFAGHADAKNQVVVSSFVPLEGIIMRGKPEEAELVVDTDWTQNTKILPSRRTSKRTSRRRR